ncbi:MAG: hypothetical protein LBG06_04485 [Deltaproteobacteria bacterium]|nr:hypothetical protein [Deltaproteobacteria bacterium]
MPLRFRATRGSSPAGSFAPTDPACFRRDKAAVGALAGRFFRRETDPASCAEACEAILRRDPLQVDALALWLDARLSSPARSSAELARDAERRLRPLVELAGDFPGTLDPEDENSIHFLSCHHTLITLMIETGRYAEALAMCLRHSRWDSRDTGGVLAFVGNLHLILGDLEGAEAFFGTPPLPMPYESAYGEALLRLLQGRPEEAAGILRRAALTQPYVAEIILRRARGPVPAWRYPDNRGLYYSALNYTDAYLGARVWREGKGEAALFLSWIYNSPGMLMERARALAILDGAGAARPADPDLALSEFHRFTQAPNPRLAVALTAPVPVGGGLLRPWLAPDRADIAAATASPGLERRLRPESREIASHEALRGDEDWLAAGAGRRTRNGRSARGAARGGADGGGSGTGGGGNGGEGARDVPIGRGRGGDGIRGGLGPGALPRDGAGGPPSRRRPSPSDALPEDPPALQSLIRFARRPGQGGKGSPFLDDGAPSPEDPADGDGASPRESWSPPGDGDYAEDEPECGDCENCEDFEECSQAPECVEEDCDECSECEIEGFCNPAAPRKDPPFRH